MAQAPNSSMAMAANELLELEAERLVQATATAAAAAAAAAVASSAAVGSQEQCTTSSSGVEVESEVQLQRAYLLKVVPLLHRSGLGRILFADELDAYLQREDSAAARTNLLLGAAQGQTRGGVFQCGTWFVSIRMYGPCISRF